MKRLGAILLIIAMLAGLYVLEQNQAMASKAAASIKSEDSSVVPYDPSIKASEVGNSKEFLRLFRDDSVKTITVVISEEEWKGIAIDMRRVSGIDQSMRTGNYRKADIIFEDKDGQVTIKNVGIRTKGNTTRVIPQDGQGYHKAHFKLKFDETFDLDPNSEEYKELSKRSFMGLDALNLKANMTDESYVHEKYGYELLAKVGLKAPKVSKTILKFKIGDKVVNYGVYSMLEPIDSKFISKRYPDKTGNLYKCLWQNFGPATLEPIRDPAAIGIKDWTKNYRPAYDLKTNKANPDHTALLEFIKNLNALNGPELKTYLDKNFEVDNFLKFMACNMLLGMPDDYWAMGNNYFLYFNPQGKIEFIPYDYDNCLASGWDGSDFGGFEGIADANILEWRNLAQSFTGQTVHHPLVEKILGIDEYKQRYLDYLREFSDPKNNLYSYANFKGLYDYIFKQYGPYMKSDTVEYSNMVESNEKWFMEEKVRSVDEQLKKLQK
ncbi:MAG: CotH kinase family protein [Clostridia bacterium]|nr:CotH kinase family protein [Clostridia bacterium]